MMSAIALLALVPAVVMGHSLREQPVENGLCDATVKSYSGYFGVDSGVDKNYFYWLFESRATPASDPLVMWLNGGPGCSSELGLLTENGPCTVNAEGTDTINNPYSWNNNAVSHFHVFGREKNLILFGIASHY